MAYAKAMTDLHEVYSTPDQLEYLSLPEIEAGGIGAVYAVSGIQIEPVSVYVGDGWFRGVYIEDRPGVRTLRVGREEHHDRKPGKTLLPLERLGAMPDSIYDEPAALVPLLVGQIRDYYGELQAQHNNSYHLTPEEIEAKYRLFHDIAVQLERSELTVSAYGDIDLHT